MRNAPPLPDYREWKSTVLLSQVRALAVAVAAGETAHAPNLAAAAGILQYRHDFPQYQGVSGPRPDSGDPAVDLMRRVRRDGNGFLSVPAGEVRRTFGTRPLGGYNLCTVPAELPADDTAPVVLYNGLAGVGSLLGTIARGEDPAAAYEAVEDRAVHNRPHPVEY